MATLIPADSRLPIRTIDPQDGKCFSAEEVCTLISSNRFDHIDLGGNFLMLIADEGEYNERATAVSASPTPYDQTDVIREHSETEFVFSIEEMESVYTYGDVLVYDYDKEEVWGL